MSEHDVNKPEREKAAAAPTKENLTLDYAHQLGIARELLAFGKGMMSGTIYAETVFTR